MRKRNPVCVDCGDKIPFDIAVPVELMGKRAYVCISCFRGGRNPKTSYRVVTIPSSNWVCSECGHNFRAKEQAVQSVGAKHRVVLCQRCVRKKRNPKPHTEVVVSKLPKCDFCNQLAHYDGKTRMGPWGYMCESHFRQFGIGLGLGKGQKLIVGKKNPTNSLYQSFHGAQPIRARKLKLRVPAKGEKLVKIGRLIEIRYQPEAPSKHKRILFSHRLGDTGSKVLPNKPILATSEDGKGLYIIEDKANPKFTERGIIG